MRKLNSKEITLLSKLLEIADLQTDVESIEVTEMQDAGMGSLAIGKNHKSRRFGEQVAEYIFKDVDGTEVSATLNLDTDNQLFEIDIFKGDFSPTQCLK